MPYVILTANGEEYDRRELTRPLILGRAPDCDIAIQDITLSRRHCRLEPSENGRSWQLVDLHSKNGTHFLGQKVEMHVFRDKDELRVGRTRLTFRAGEFVASKKPKSRGVIRPVDPHEALAGTVSGMVVCEPGETETYQGMPVPQPRPTDPKCFEQDDVYGMINDIASNSWDSVQAQASEPTRMQRATPVPGVTTAASAPARPKPRVSFALQADNPQDAVNGKALPSQALDRTAEHAATAARRDTHFQFEPMPTLAAPQALSAPVHPTPLNGLALRLAAIEQAIRDYRFPRRAQRVVMALGTTAAVTLLFIGWCSFLLYITRDPGPAAVPQTAPQSPAVMPDVFDASQPAAMRLPFVEAS